MYYQLLGSVSYYEAIQTKWSFHWSLSLLQERQFSERQVASYERELNDILERHKMDMKALELTCMKARQDLERSGHYIELSFT